MFFLLSPFYLATTGNIIPEHLPQPAIVAVNSTSNPTPPSKKSSEELISGFELIPVGINQGKRNIIKTVLVRGKEDGSQAVEFDKWLVPYDAVIKALQFDVKTLPDGQLQLRSPGIVTRIDLSKIRNDPELGLVFSIQDLQTLFNITAEFNINDYAIVLNIPWSDNNFSQNNIVETPVVIEGLPKVKAPIFSFSNIQQQVNINGISNLSPTYQGDLSAIGTAFGGSWYLRGRQQNLLDSRTWNLSKAQFFLQNNFRDYLIGSQIPFWNSVGNNDYWGLTTIERRGFKPVESFGSEPNVRQRVQGAQATRTISGKAEPGTLVRLVRGFNDRQVAEILVDSSGIYRFEDVIINNNSFLGNYRLLLYPQGRLTQVPEIRDVSLSTVSGQIPVGTSALIVSAGWNKKTNTVNGNFFGDFNDFRGGIAQRWGVTEDLTVGIGGVYDKTFRGLGEIFYQSANLPLSVAVSALSADDKGNWNVDADVRFTPTKNINANFRSDAYSQRLNINWNLINGLTFIGNIDSKNASAAGLQIINSGRSNFTFVRATLDTENRWRWNLLQRNGQLQFTQQGNEISTSSELSYNLASQNLSDSGNSLLLGYDTINLSGGSNNLLNLAWRYRSKNRRRDGRNLWEMQLGYGVGSKGSGISAVLQTAVIPGLLLQARYQDISLTSSEPSFSIQLTSNFNLQGGIFANSNPSDTLRTQGGLIIRPFLDRNQNGKPDAGEEFYTSNPDLLLILNNQPLKPAQLEIHSNSIFVTLQPGTYRLDLDSAGFPADWQGTVDAYAVDVAPGAYTTVLLPFVRAYSLSGVITDATGQGVAGAKVEAISTDKNIRRFSVTNSAGVYYLENLPQGDYQLQINSQTVQNVILNDNSPSFQELNLGTDKK